MDNGVDGIPLLVKILILLCSWLLAALGREDHCVNCADVLDFGDWPMVALSR